MTGDGSINWREVHRWHGRERKVDNQVSSGGAAKHRRVQISFSPPESKFQAQELQCAFHQLLLITFTFHVSRVNNNPLDIIESFLEDWEN